MALDLRPVRRSPYDLPPRFAINALNMVSPDVRDIETALANKYGASMALNRDPAKRAMDMVDFYTMVRHSMAAMRS